MNSAAITVVIAARNAAATVGRAAASAGAHPVLLIDDGSTDGTAEAARAVKPAGLTVIRVPESRGLGHARQYGLAAVATPLLVWLDADDELAPGRIEQLGAALAAGADGVWDAADLHDGATGKFLRPLPVPPFLLRAGALVRTFERNYLPGPAWPALRTAFARSIGYDSEQTTGDDVDFIFRALVAGGRLVALPSAGYRQYAYGTSLSRNLALQRSMLARALRKHDYGVVRQLYLAAGFDPRIANWGLCSMALFREEPAAALAFLAAACPANPDLRQVLETDGPLPVPEGWRLGFYRGTIHCLLGNPREALADFAAAADYPLTDLLAAGGIPGAPDLLNNWGVALAATGRATEARAKFDAALALFPGYLDAKLNLAAESPSHLTTHPLRRQPSRREY